MVSRIFSAWVWLVVAIALLTSDAYAQLYPRPQYPRRPPISPYIDLLKREGPTYMYYRRIRPEMELRRQLQLNQMRLQQLQTRVALQGERLNRLIGTRFGSIVLPRPSAAGGGVTGGVQGLPPTGHPTAFGDLGGYFPGLGGSIGGAVSGLGGGASVRAPAPVRTPTAPSARRYSPPRPRTSGPQPPQPRVGR